MTCVLWPVPCDLCFVPAGEIASRGREDKIKHVWYFWPREANSSLCAAIVSTSILVPRVSRARRDPGRVWSRAFVTIENTREGSSLNKEFVPFVTLIQSVVKFLHTQPRLRRAILQWPSWTDFYNVNIFDWTAQSTATYDRHVYVFFGVCKLLSPDIARRRHMFTYASTWNLVCFGDNTFRTPVVSV